MSTPPSSIEEVAKRVKELAATDARVRHQRLRLVLRHERDCPKASSQSDEFACDCMVGVVVEVLNHAPQLAEWVEKALPVIEAARAVELSDSLSSVRPAIACWDAQIGELRRALRALDPPSSLAAEGTTEGASPPP